MMKSMIGKAAGALCGAVALAAMLLAGPASATVYTFDDLGPLIQPIGAYHGLDFNNFDSLAPSAYPWMASTGYAHGVVSPHNIAFNDNGGPASISDPTGHFSLISAFFTSAYLNGLKLQIAGLDNGVVKFTKTLFLNTTTPTKVYFNWAGIDTVKFVSSYCGCSPKGRQFVMDNLKLLPGVPEPSTWALMIVGFGGVGLMIRSTRRRELARAAA
jgi:hypothetical protein